MGFPTGVDEVEQLPHGRTAQRLTWTFLPRPVRELVEERLGSPVAEAISQGGGFTPGFASVLVGEDGSRLFVKAASRKAQAAFAGAYAEEARMVRQLGDRIPSPELLWTIDEDWVVLGFEAIAGRTPRRPWRAPELRRALDLAEQIATMPVDTAGLGLRPIAEELPQLVTGWDHVAQANPDWPHLADAAALAREFAALPMVHFAHSDLRDDNILLADDGRNLACDWNWPTLAPAWIDLVDLLASAHGDGLDADALAAERDLLRDVPAEQIDAWLAAFCGFMLESGAQPTPPTSPYLRLHARWYAAAAWSWLARRRGWGS